MINEQFINELVTLGDYIAYDEDFNPVPSNNKRIEESFFLDRGRRMNPGELEVLKTSLHDRAIADRAFLDDFATEKCLEHKELVMHERTLDDGMEAFTDAVTAEVQHALDTKGIAFEYTVKGHPESDDFLTSYVVAAIEVDQRNG
jgi:hypothetical protein